MPYSTSLLKTCGFPVEQWPSEGPQADSTLCWEGLSPWGQSLYNLHVLYSPLYSLLVKER